MDPVTQAYLTCLKTDSERIKNEISAGKYLDISNNDLSMNKTFNAMGHCQAIDSMSNFNGVLNRGEMIEVTKDEG